VNFSALTAKTRPASGSPAAFRRSGFLGAACASREALSSYLRRASALLRVLCFVSCGALHPSAHADVGAAVAQIESLREHVAPTELLKRFDSELRACETTGDEVGALDPSCAALFRSAAALWNALGRGAEALRLIDRNSALPNLSSREKFEAALERSSALLVLGRIEESKDVASDALASLPDPLAGTAFSPSDRLRAMAALAASWAAGGKVQEALETRQQVVTGFERLFGPNAPRTIQARQALANSLYDVNRLAEASGEERAVLRARQRSLGANHPLVFSAMNNLAATLAALGRHRESAAFAARVYAFREATLPEGSHERLASAMNYAAALSEVGKVTPAVIIARRVVATRQRYFGLSHPETVSALGVLASTYMKAGRVKDADSTISAAERAIFEHLSSPQRTDEEQKEIRLRYVHDLQFYAEWRGRRGGEVARRGFLLSERAKGATFLRELAIQRLGGESAATAAQPARTTNSQRGEIEFANRGRDQLLAASGRTEDGIMRSALERGQLGFVPGRGEVYVSWTHDNFDRLSAWTVDSLGRVRFIPLGQHRRIAETVEVLRSALALDPQPVSSFRRRDGSFTLSTEREVGDQQVRGDVIVQLTDYLSALLIKPLRRSLLNSPHIVASLDGGLSHLPLAALKIDGKPVAANHSVALVPGYFALTELVARSQENREQRTGNSSVLVFADAHYDDADGVHQPESRGQRGSAKRGPPMLSTNERQDTWPTLPATRAEALAIQRHVAALAPTMRVNTVLGKEVSLATIVSLQAQGAFATADIVHFATHASAESGAGAQIVLSRTPASRGDHGNDYETFTAKALSQVKTHAELIVFSGCDTALGRVYYGDGLDGLSRAGLLAGARHVLTSLWPVDDEAASKFMDLFYQAYLKHRHAPQALASAQQALAADPVFGHVRHWAPYVLFGR